MPDGAAPRQPIVLIASEPLIPGADAAAAVSAVAQGVQRAEPAAQVYSLGFDDGTPLTGADLLVVAVRDLPPDGLAGSPPGGAAPAGAPTGASALALLVERARAARVPVLALAGRTSLPTGALADHGVGLLLSVLEPEPERRPDPGTAPDALTAWGSQGRPVEPGAPGSGAGEPIPAAVDRSVPPAAPGVPVNDATPANDAAPANGTVPANSTAPAPDLAARLADAAERGALAFFHPAAIPGAPGAPAAASATPSALPVEPRLYFHFLRTPRARWWKGLLVIVSFLVGFFVLSLIFGGAAIAIDIGTGRRTFEDVLSNPTRITPVLFLFNNLSLAALIPLAMVLQRAFYGQRPRWLSSVHGGFRWRWMWRSALITVPVFVIYFVIQLLIDPLPVGRIGPDAIFLLVSILVTTPLQAAGEEYAARGLIQRAAGSWTRRPFVAFLIGSVIANGLFMLGHAAGDPWLNVFYFSLGVMLSVLAWRTGGLEAGIAIHAVNNLIGLIPLALYGDIDQAFERSADSDNSGGPAVLLQLLVVFIVVVLVSLLAKRIKLARFGPPDVAAAPIGTGPASTGPSAAGPTATGPASTGSRSAEETPADRG